MDWHADLFQPHFVVTVMGLNCDFIFAGKPSDGHKKQALRHSHGFDQRRKCRRALPEKDMPQNSRCCSDWRKLRAPRGGRRAGRSDRY